MKDLPFVCCWGAVAFAGFFLVLSLAKGIPAPKPPVVIEAEPAKEQTFYIRLPHNFADYSHIKRSTITFQPDGRLTFTNLRDKTVILGAATPWVMEEE